MLYKSIQPDQTQSKLATVNADTAAERCVVPTQYTANLQQNLVVGQKTCPRQKLNVICLAYMVHRQYCYDYCQDQYSG